MQADAADSKGAAQLGDPSKFELVSPNGPSEGPATAVFVYGLSEIMTSGYNGITMATGEKVFKITTCPPWVGYAGDTLPLCVPKTTVEGFDAPIPYGGQKLANAAAEITADKQTKFKDLLNFLLQKVEMQDREDGAVDEGSPKRDALFRILTSDANHATRLTDLTHWVVDVAHLGVPGKKPRLDLRTLGKKYCTHSDFVKGQSRQQYKSANFAQRVFLALNMLRNNYD